MTSQDGERWFRSVARAFAAWNVLGSAAAIASGVMWRRSISDETRVLVGFFAHGIVFAAIGVLAFLSALRRLEHKRWLWWTAIAVGTIDWIVGVLRIGLHGDDLVDLGVLVVAAGASYWLTRPATYEVA